MRRFPTFCLAGLLLLSACGANWRPVTFPTSEPLRPADVIEFRARDSLVRLHAVHVKRDSLSGIPWLEHASCNACRVSFALANVHDLRIGHPGTGAWTLMIPTLAIVAFALGLRYTHFSD